MTWGKDRWTKTSEGLLIASLVVSFQRFVRDESGEATAGQRSLGALPIAQAAADMFLLPVDDDEAFWIGIVSGDNRPMALAIAAERDDAVVVDVVRGGAWNESAPGWHTVPPVQPVMG